MNVMRSDGEKVKFPCSLRMAPALAVIAAVKPGYTRVPREETVYTLPLRSPSSGKCTEVDDAPTRCQSSTCQADIGKTDILPLSDARVLFRVTS